MQKYLYFLSKTFFRNEHLYTYRFDKSREWYTNMFSFDFLSILYHAKVMLYFEIQMNTMEFPIFLHKMQDDQLCKVLDIVNWFGHVPKQVAFLRVSFFTL